MFHVTVSTTSVIVSSEFPNMRTLLNDYYKGHRGAIICYSGAPGAPVGRARAEPHG